MVGHALANASPKIGERQRPCVGIAINPIFPMGLGKVFPVGVWLWGFPGPFVVGDGFQAPQYGRKYSATAINGISRSIIVMA